MEVKPCADPKVFSQVVLDSYQYLPSASTMFPEGITPEIRSMFAELATQQMSADDGTTWVQATDTATGEVLGVSKWTLDHRPSKEDSHKVEIGAADVAAGKVDVETTGKPDSGSVNHSMLTDAASQKDAFTKAYFGGKRYITFATLAVLQEHQRKGVGRTLLQSCLETADKEGFDVFLESTAVAEKLYLNNGFNVVGNCKITLRDGSLQTQQLMVRKFKW